jgi:hypothetical protein
MAIFGINIRKQVTFRGSLQPFSNTYFYEIVGPSSSILDVDLNLLLDKLILEERGVHSSEVEFSDARVWSAGGTPLENETRFIRDLSSLGQLGQQANLDRERCVLIQWPAGRSILQRKVYLRKWYHVCGLSLGNVAWTDAVLQQSLQVSSTIRSSYASFAARLRTIETLPGPLNWNLVSEKGREITAAGAMHTFLEHHQLGELWR